MKDKRLEIVKIEDQIRDDVGQLETRKKQLLEKDGALTAMESKEVSAIDDVIKQKEDLLKDVNEAWVKSSQDISNGEDEIEDAVYRNSCFGGCLRTICPASQKCGQQQMMAALVGVPVCCCCVIIIIVALVFTLRGTLSDSS